MGKPYNEKKYMGKQAKLKAQKKQQRATSPLDALLLNKKFRNLEVILVEVIDGSLVVVHDSLINAAREDLLPHDHQFCNHIINKQAWEKIVKITLYDDLNDKSKGIPSTLYIGESFDIDNLWINRMIPILKPHQPSTTPLTILPNQPT